MYSPILLRAYQPVSIPLEPISAPAALARRFIDDMLACFKEIVGVCDKPWTVETG